MIRHSHAFVLIQSPPGDQNPREPHPCHNVIFYENLKPQIRPAQSQKLYLGQIVDLAVEIRGKGISPPTLGALRR